HTNKQTNTGSHTCAHTNIQHKHTCSHSHKKTHYLKTHRIHTHARKHTDTHKHIHTPAHTHTYTHPCTHTLTQITTPTLLSSHGRRPTLPVSKLVLLFFPFLSLSPSISPFCVLCSFLSQK